MITDNEKRIIDAFDILFKESSRDKKIQLYKIINADLTKCEAECDNFSIRNYCKQFLFDLSNHECYELNLEVFKAFSLILDKTLKKRIKLSVGMEHEILIKILDCCKITAPAYGIEFVSDVEFLSTTCIILNDKRVPTEIFTEYEREIHLIVSNVFDLKIEEHYQHAIQLLMKHLKVILNAIGTETEPTLINNQDDEMKISIWFKQLLPLVFKTQDEKFRTVLLVAFEQYSLLLPHLHYRNMPFWIEVKTAIFDTYATSLHELRNTSPQWYRIWNILAQIVSTEILKSASIINKFLTIVEIGFRGDDLKIRAQAYLCWRSLIEIFGRDNELNVAKRIRLVCIPLKPARPKTQEIAINKFKAWWCLITKLNESMAEHLQTILFPFLEFCFGKLSPTPLESYFDNNESQHKALSIAKLYTQSSNSIRNMTICAFAQIIAQKSTVDVKAFHAILKQEIDILPAPIDFSKDMKVVADTFINYCGEITVLISHNGPQSNKLCEILWRNLLNMIKGQSTYEHFDLIVKNIHGLVRVCQKTNNLPLSKLIPDIIELVIKSEIYPFKEVDCFFNSELIFIAIKRLTLLILQDMIFYFKINDIIKLMFENLHRYRQNTLIDKIIDFITVDCDEFSSENQVSLKAEIWHALAEPLSLRLGELVASEESDIIQSGLKYLIWPLKNIRCIEDSKRVLENWTMIFNHMDLKLSMNVFINKISKSFNVELQKSHKEEVEKLVPYCCHILKSTRKSFDSSEQTTDVLRLVNLMMTKSISQNNRFDGLSIVLSDATEYMKNLKKAHFNVLAKEITELVQNATVLGNTFSEISLVANNLKLEALRHNKTTKTEKLNKSNDTIVVPSLCARDNSKKTAPKLTKAPVNPNDVMVVIPSVWKLKPDKLTEHQIEKMKERRNDIPALYNDTSVSQDSMQSIKPWTPRRIIVAGETSSDKIVIEDSSLADSLSNGVATIPEQTIFKEPPTTVEKTPMSNGFIDKIIEQVTNENFAISKTNDEDVIVSSQVASPLLPRASKRRRTINAKIDNPDTTASVGGQTTIKNRRTVSPNNKIGKPVTRPKRTSAENKAEVIINWETASISNNSVLPENCDTLMSMEQSKSEPELKTIDSMPPPDLKSDATSPSKELKEKEVKSLPVVQTNDAAVKTKMNALKENTKNKDNEATLQPEAVKETIKDNEQRPDMPIADDINKELEKPKETSVIEKKEVPIIVEKLRTSPRKQTLVTPPAAAPISPKKLVLRIVRKESPPDQKKKEKFSIENTSEKENFESNLMESQPTDLNAFLDAKPVNGQLIDSTEPTDDQKSDNDENESIKSNDGSIVSIEEYPANLSAKTIRSSPELSDGDERDQDMLNNTLNLSPIHNTEPEKPAAASDTPKPLPPTPLISSPELRRRYTLAHRSSPVTQTYASSPLTSAPKTGRGFQSNRGRHLIDLIREQQKPDGAKSSKTEILVDSLMNGKREGSPAITSTPNTPMENRLLTFSKKLPPSSASPSISILKRKFDESADESPMSKRKRVSFHDPPVSETTEYEIEENANLTSTSAKRCLLMSRSQVKVVNTIPRRFSQVRDTSPPSFSMESLKMNNTPNDTNDEDDEEISLTPSPSISFANDEAVVQSVLEKYTPEEYKEKYMEAGKIVPSRAVQTIISEMKTSMSEDKEAKLKILDSLSEQYPKDFLAHAIRENSSETVCESLNYPSVLDYIFKQCATDPSMKTKLCARIQENAGLLETIDSSTVLDCVFTKSGNDLAYRQKLFYKIDQMFGDSDGDSGEQEEMDPASFELLTKLFSKKLSKSQVLKLIDKKLKD